MKAKERDCTVYVIQTRRADDKTADGDITQQEDKVSWTMTNSDTLVKITPALILCGKVSHPLTSALTKPLGDLLSQSSLNCHSCSGPQQLM